MNQSKEHLLLISSPSNPKKLLRVTASNYKVAVDKACSLYPGRLVNYKNAKRIDLWELRNLLSKCNSMKMFSSCKENRGLITEINNLIDERKFVLVLVKNKIAYLLDEHHKYIYPEVKARRIKLGSIHKTEDGMYYFYTRMTLLEVSEDSGLKIARKGVIIKKKK